MERIVALCGIAVGLMIAGIFFYLAFESRSAFDRKYPYGFRFAAQSTSAPDEELLLDPNSSLLAAHPDGKEGLDEKDEAIAMPTLDELSGVATTATGVPLTGDPGAVENDKLFKDDWRAQKAAGSSDHYLLFAFATPEHQEEKLRFKWEPDAAFDPSTAAHNVRIELLNRDGIAPFAVDLTNQPKGFVDLPTRVAKTDDERTSCYTFRITATPKTSSNILAALSGFFRTDWAPTLQYPRFGFVPLLLSTVLITLLAMLLAAGPAILTAVFMSEVAPPRLREYLKPILELLAAVPTVILGYFGLMLVAPQLMRAFGEALQMESGRSVLTASIMMAVLILPTITSIAEDALRTLPGTYRDGALALGMTPFESLKKVLIPGAKTGLVAALLLGFARAIGETMIVWILAGGTVLMPNLSSPRDAARSFVQPGRGIADTIGIEMANVEFERPHYGHLFLLGLVLFSLTIIINLAGYHYARRRAWQT